MKTFKQLTTELYVAPGKDGKKFQDAHEPQKTTDKADTGEKKVTGNDVVFKATNAKDGHRQKDQASPKDKTSYDLGVTKEETEGLEEKELSPGQKEIAKQAGDPDKIDAADFKALRKKKMKESLVSVLTTKETEELDEREMTPAETKKKEEIAKAMKKGGGKAGLQKRYGKRWKDVMYATATKRAMESVEIELTPELEEAVEKTVIVKHVSGHKTSGSFGHDAQQLAKHKQGVDVGYRKNRVKNVHSTMEETENLDEGDNKRDSAIPDISDPAQAKALAMKYYNMANALPQDETDKKKHYTYLSNKLYALAKRLKTQQVG